MPHGEPKPELKTIDELAQHLQQIWDQAHHAWDTKLSYYEGTFRVWPDHLTEIRPSFHPPTAASKVDGAVNSLLAVTPKIHRVTGSGKREEAKGDRIEPWLSAILEATSRKLPLPHIRESKQNLMLLGTTFLEGPTLEETEPPEEPSRKKGEGKDGWDRRYRQWIKARQQWMPIKLFVPAPKTILLDPYERIPSLAIKRAKWHAKDLQAMLEKKKGYKHFEAEVFDLDTSRNELRNPYEQIACDELWTLYWHAMRGPKGLLFVEENLSGFVPFTHSFTGWGQSYTGSEVQSGATTATDLSWAVTAMSRGILDGILETLKLEAQGMTGLHEALIRSSIKKLLTRKDKLQVAEEMEGDIVGGVGKDDLSWLEDPGVQAHVFQTLDGYTRAIEANTFPAVLVGVRPEGVTTVGSHALLRKDAGSKFAAPVENMGQMYSIVCSNILRLVETLGEDISAGGELIGPSDIAGNYEVQVAFESSDPIIRFQEIEQARQDVKDRLMSRETYFAIKGQEDATGEERRIMEDTVMQSPEVQQLIALVVKQGLGMQDLQAQVMQLQATQQPPGGKPATGAAPGLPPSTAVVPEGSPQEAASVGAGMEGVIAGG